MLWFITQIIDFVQHRVAYDYCGEERTLASHPDVYTKAAHLEFLQCTGSNVLGRDQIVQQVGTSSNCFLKYYFLLNTEY